MGIEKGNIADFVMTVTRILGDRPITPPNMLPLVANCGCHVMDV
jgi:hypothetical protein